MLETYRLSRHVMNPYDWTLSFMHSFNVAFGLQQYLLHVCVSLVVMIVLNELFSGFWIIHLFNFCHLISLIVFFTYFFYVSFIKIPGILLLGLWRTWSMPRYKKDALLAFK